MERIKFGILYPYYFPPAPSLQPGEFARMVEDMGFDSFWTGEAPTNRGFSHDAFTVLCFATAATKRITIGTSATVLPLHHPVEVAKQMASLDVLSGGRTVLTLGAGGEYPKQFEACGVQVKDRGLRTDEATQVMKALWTQKSATFHGKLYDFEGISMEPKPVQKPHIPLWMGGRLAGHRTAGEKPRSLIRVARYGDGWNPYRLTPETYKFGVQAIKAAAEAEGRQASDIALAVTSTMSMAKTAEEGLETARAWWQVRFGLDLTPSVIDKYLLGSIDHVVGRIEQFVKAGVQHFILQFACPPERIPREMELVMKEIVRRYR